MIDLELPAAVVVGVSEFEMLPCSNRILLWGSSCLYACESAVYTTIRLTSAVIGWSGRPDIGRWLVYIGFPYRAWWKPTAGTLRLVVWPMSSVSTTYEDNFRHVFRCLRDLQLLGFLAVVIDLSQRDTNGYESSPKSRKVLLAIGLKD